MLFTPSSDLIIWMRWQKLGLQHTVVQFVWVGASRSLSFCSRLTGGATRCSAYVSCNKCSFSELLLQWWQLKKKKKVWHFLFDFSTRCFFPEELAARGLFTGPVLANLTEVCGVSVDQQVFLNIPNDSAIIRSHSIFNVIELAVFQSETNWSELRSWRGIGRFYFPISQNFEVSVVFLLLLYFLLEFWELSFTQSEKSEDWNQVLFFFFAKLQ